MYTYIGNMCSKYFTDKMCDPKRVEMNLPVRMGYAVVTNGPQTSVTTKNVYFMFMLYVSCGPSIALFCIILSLQLRMIEPPLSGTSPVAVAERGEKKVNRALVKLLLGSDTCHFCLDFTGQRKLHGHM